MASTVRHLFAIGVALAGTIVARPADAALVIGCGQTFELVTQKRDSVEQLVFDAVENEVVSITVAAAAGQEPNFNPEFFLESPDGDRIFFSNGSQLCANSIHQCETQPLPVAGTYTINARDAGRNQKGAFFLTLEAVSATAGGFSNGPCEAPDCPLGAGPVCQRTNAAGKADGTQPVAIGSPAGGTIDSPGETDTFTFNVAAGRVVTLEIEALRPAAGPFEPRAALFDPNGQEVGDVCLAGETCTFGPLVDGVHTVKLFDIDYAGTGDYTLLLAEPPPPSTTTTSTTITPTTTLSTSTTSTTMPTADLFELWKTLRRQLPVGESLGKAIAANQTRIVIGVPFDQTSGPTAGRVYVVSLAGLPPSPPDYRAPVIESFERPGGSGAGDLFGGAVALLEGDAMAVSAPRVDAVVGSGTLTDSGAVYLYPGGTELRWPTVAAAEFGATLTSQGGDLYVGAPGEQAGRVYRFVAGELSQVFGPADSGVAIAPGARFGSAIAVVQGPVGSIPAGGLLAIGAPGDGTMPGTVFLLDRTTGDWQVLRAPSPTNGDLFGSAVAFVDGTLVIGARGVGKVFRLQAGETSEMALPVRSSLGASLADAGGGKFLVGAPNANPGVVLLVDVATESIDSQWFGAAGDFFGDALAAAGSSYFIGAPGDDTGSVDGGAVFVQSAARGGAAVAVLRKREGDTGFGTDVAGDDAVVVVGAPDDTGAGAPFDSGVVYSYRPALCTDDSCLSTWSRNGAVAAGLFGQAVELTGSAALIGAPFAGEQGAAYLAAVEGEQVRDVPNASAEAGAQFGFAVTAVGNDLLVGAPAQGQGTATGRVHVFDASTNPIRLRTTLSNPVPESGDQFGAAIAAEGNAVAVGAPYDSTATDRGGAVYLFDRGSARLLTTKPLVSPAATGVELFGAAVAMDADSIVVGAPSASAEPARSGRVYVFDRASLELACAIDDPLLEAGASFGASVALVDGRVLVGAPLTSNRQPYAGAAYLFERQGAVCTLVQTFLSPEAPLGGDLFGKSVSAGPSGLVIGSPGRARVYVYRQTAPQAQGVAAVLSMLRDTIVPTAIAAAPICGNGVIDAGEVCDDGNTDDTDDCRNDCSGGFCCVIDPTAGQRCNDFDPCTNDSFDPATNRCVNVDNGTCCMSNNDCAGQTGVCRICAGCSLFPWDCCEQDPETRCVLSTPECAQLDCFDQPVCECQSGLTCDEEGAEPTEAMAEAFRQSCDVLRLQAGGPYDENAMAQARRSSKQARKALRQTRHKTRQAYRAGDISKTCRSQYNDQIRRVRRSIPTKLRMCVKEQQSGNG